MPIISVLGPVEEKKQIKLIRKMDSESETAILEPRSWNYIELVAKGYYDNQDVIFCYNNPKIRGQGQLYIGEWNDGIV